MDRPPRSPAPRRAAFAAFAAAALLCACAHSYELERRETPVHVWLSVPEFAARGGQIEAVVYVGPHKVVEGPVAFAPGIQTVRLPTAYLRAGPHRVSVILRGGRPSVTTDVTVEGEGWLHIVVRGPTASVELLSEQPRLGPR